MNNLITTNENILMNQTLQTIGQLIITANS